MEKILEIIQEPFIQIVFATFKLGPFSKIFNVCTCLAQEFKQHQHVSYELFWTFNTMVCIRLASPELLFLHARKSLKGEENT